jgi:predicted acylesterase/phospholipase RssA
MKGKNILDSVIEELLDNKGLNEATDLVISGCSAGATATYITADHWND